MVWGKSKWSANLESPDGKIPVAIYARASSNSQDVENSTEGPGAQSQRMGREEQPHRHAGIHRQSPKREG